MRRLATTLCVLGTLVLATPRAGAAPAAARPHVDVIELHGLIDPVLADFTTNVLAEAARAGAAAVVLQVDSGGGVLSRSRADALVVRVARSPVPVAVWVGPSGARAEGLAYSLVRAAAVSGTATRTRIGRAPSPAPGGPGPLADRAVSGRAALQQGVVAIDAPTLGDFVVALGDREVGGRRLDIPSAVVRRPGRPPQQQPDVVVRFAKPNLTARLLHTVASPSVAYLLLVTGLLLVVLEFFTAGIGVAAVVAAGCLVGAGYGLAVVPTRGWAAALVAIGVGGFAIDLQAGAPRLWTVVGTLGLVVGTVRLFSGPGLSLLAMAVGVGGTALFMVAGMPAMVRARFSTPTIGRESMVGEMGTAVADVSPDGTVEVLGAQWRARTNRATPIPAGDAVRVVGIDGLLLEVEPETGGAKEAGH